MLLPIPEPVPPAMEWHSTKPCTDLHETKRQLDMRARHLQRIAVVRFSIDNVEDFFVQLLALVETLRPVITYGWSSDRREEKDGYCESIPAPPPSLEM